VAPRLPRPQLLDPALAKRSSYRALSVGVTGERRPEPRVGLGWQPRAGRGS
jgi:hypothetical protein